MTQESPKEVSEQLRELFLSILPARRRPELITQPAEYKESDANVWREGFNAAREEMEKKIKSLHSEAFTEVINKAKNKLTAPQRKTKNNPMTKPTEQLIEEKLKEFDKFWELQFPNSHPAEYGVTRKFFANQIEELIHTIEEQGEMNGRIKEGLSSFHKQD